MSITPADRAASSFLIPGDIVYMAINAIGIAIYLRLASNGWRIPEEHGMVPVTGEPFLWAFALPVLGIFFLIDIAWGVVLLRNKDGKGGLWWALVAVSWIVALVVDFYHH
jgi:hypothetical protein